VDNLPCPAVQQFGPNQFAFMRTAAQSAREQKVLGPELLDHCPTYSFKQSLPGFSRILLAKSLVQGRGKEAHECEVHRVAAALEDADT
jgi:hypothetical protein